jgi:hypothetical protein
MKNRKTGKILKYLKVRGLLIAVGSCVIRKTSCDAIKINEGRSWKIF